MKIRMKHVKKYTSILLLFVMLLSVFTSSLPQLVFAVDGSITVDGNNEDWTDEEPVATSPEAGWDNSNIDNLYFKNDGNYLYFWVDAANVPNWGDDGQYLNLALQVNDDDSEVDGNPLGYPYDFSGTDKKPQYHLIVQVKGDKEINNAALYSTNDFEKPILSSNDLQGAEFAVDREVGFEGKIPLNELGLENDDKLSAIVVLSGNNENEHGAFDVIPSAKNNNLADDWNMSDTPNVQSTYSSAYKVTGVQERTQLEITGKTPGSGQSPISVQPTISYSEPIELENDHMMTLKDSQGNAVTFQTVASANKLTIIPGELAYGETYVSQCLC